MSTFESGLFLLLKTEKEDWVDDMSKEECLRLSEAEELDGTSSGVEDDDSTEVDAVASPGGCMP